MRKYIKEMVYDYNVDREVLVDDYYKNYHYVIISLGSYPVAYVEIENIAPNTDYSDIIDCHGGITYQEPFLKLNNNTQYQGHLWIGWDYAHLGDYMAHPPVFIENDTGKKWTTIEIIEHCQHVINQLPYKSDEEYMFQYSDNSETDYQKVKRLFKEIGIKCACHDDSNIISIGDEHRHIALLDFKEGNFQLLL